MATHVLDGVLLWQVLVAGQRCELVPGTLTSTSLSCTAPPLWGRVLGEYWPINGYVPDLPADLEEWTNPGAPAALPALHMSCCTVLRVPGQHWTGC